MRRTRTGIRAVTSRKASWLIILSLQAVCLIIPSTIFADNGREILLDRIAATVNGEIITLSEVREMAAPIIARLPYDIDRNAAANEAETFALDAIIDDRLLRQEARRRGISITEADIDRAISEVRRQHGMGEAEFRSALSGQGYTWESYRNELGHQLERYRLLGSEVHSRVNITDEDVQSLLARRGAGRTVDEAKVRHILIRVEENSSPETIEKKRLEALSVLEKLQEEDFSELARRKSQDPSSSSGGELGWVRRNRMTAALNEAVFENDEIITGPIRSPFGWHIIEVMDRRTVQSEQDELMAERARQNLMEKAVEQETKRFINGLRRRAVIEIRLEEEL